MREVLSSLLENLRKGHNCLLCQVVETRGSTPQKAGAPMLVLSDGRQVGSLGGGCVEAEVKQRAMSLLGREASELHDYLLDHDYAWADGLICGGRMVIIAQSLLGPSSIPYFQRLLDLFQAGKGFTEVVVTDPNKCGNLSLGSRFLFDSECGLAASWPGAPIDQNVSRLVLPIQNRPRPRATEGVAVLPVVPRIRLLIVGAGHIGQAVAELAARADFEVWVLDDRQQYANKDRFPGASRLLVGPIESTLAGLDLDDQTYALIVTRGHGHDQEALQQLAPTAAAYVGLIGSRRKIRLIYDTLIDLGVPQAALDRVAAPVGLVIGSESIPEIAISIVAELIARRNLGPSSLLPRGWFRQPATPERSSP